MAKKLSYERYLWFHGKLKRGRYPTLSEMSDFFEISLRQSAREIEFMRNFFRAPIEYSAYERGYYYSDEKFELPGLWAADEEIITLMIARKLSGMIPDSARKRRFKSLVNEILRDTGMDVMKFEKHFSVKNVRYSKVIPSVFESVLISFINDRKLRISYSSPYSGLKSERTISPIHLILYMGNWHLIAYCDLKKDKRDFLLSRISDVEMLEDAIPPDIKNSIDKKDIYKNYGIFFSGKREDVVLKFCEKSSEIVKKQIWFPEQKISEDEDGNIILSFPVADYREILGDILRFGNEVEVLSPLALREKLKLKIDEMKKIYEE